MSFLCPTYWNSYTFYKDDAISTGIGTHLACNFNHFQCHCVTSEFRDDIKIIRLEISVSMKTHFTIIMVFPSPSWIPNVNKDYLLIIVHLLDCFLLDNVPISILNDPCPFTVRTGSQMLSLITGSYFPLQLIFIFMAEMYSLVT